MKRPAPLVMKERNHPSKKFCRYHNSGGHNTNGCRALKEDIEELIQKGKLRQYVKKDGDQGAIRKRTRSPSRKRSRSPWKGKAPAKEEAKDSGSDDSDTSDEEDFRRAKGRPVAMVIQSSNPLDDWGSNRSVKRMWRYILNIASTSASREGPDRPPLAFTDSDLHDGKPNMHIPLLVSAIMVNMEVRRILVDQGSAVDVIFEDLLEVLKISRKEFTPYSGKDLTGFNGSSTKPLGQLELMVTYGNPDGEEAMFRTVKTVFLVLPCKSVYQCIIGRPTLGKLEAVTSTMHLKMKFYNLENKVVTIPTDLGGAFS